jgi:hypothetical protein
MFVAPQDFILNGKGHGPVASTLADVQFDTGLLRPFFDGKGRNCVVVNTGRRERRKKNDGSYVTNKDGIPVDFPVHEKRLVADLIMNHGMSSLIRNATVLTKEQWITLTNIVRTEFRKRLRAWTDLMSASSFGGFDGMSTMVLEYQTMSDPGEAVVDFDGMTEGRADQPLFKLEGLPLPITHSDFWFPERLLAISRRNGTPLNTRMAEAAGRRVAESVEKTLIGTLVGPTLGNAAAGTAGIAYGRAATVHGYTTHPARSTKTDITAPSAGGWTAQTLIDELLVARDTMYGNNFFGPFMLYHSTDWDKYLDDDYSTTADAGSKTLRMRIRDIEGFQDMRRLDFLTSTFTILMVQMTSDVVQAVNGMDINTVQWPTMGGMRVNFKVMTIQVPLMTPDYQDRLGVMHCTTA